MSGSCWKLLYHVAAEGSLLYAELLLEHGANVAARCDLCPTALWSAAKTEDSQMIRFLVYKGANLNDCDIYGRTLLHLAEQYGLDAAATLSELGAQREVPRHTANEVIENSVSRFSRELSETRATGSWPSWLPLHRWLMLARCLYLGNDVLNAVISSEQTFTVCQDPNEARDISVCVSCSICNSMALRSYHLCKEGEKFGICESRCLKKHESILRERGTLEEHESLTYPRPFFATIPKDHVAVGEKEFILLEDWLEGLANWKVKPEQE